MLKEQEGAFSAPERSHLDMDETRWGELMKGEGYRELRRRTNALRQDPAVRERVLQGGRLRRADLGDLTGIDLPEEMIDAVLDAFTFIINPMAGTQGHQVENPHVIPEATDPIERRSP